MKTLADYSPLVASEWDYSKNELTPDDVSRSDHKHFWWLGVNCGHSWRATVNNRVNFKTGCPICARRKVSLGINDLSSVKPEIALEWAPRNDELPEAFTFKSRERVYWICSKCSHEWLTAIQNRTIGRKTGCPKCSRNSSKLESIALAYIASLTSASITLRSRPLAYKNSKLELDIYLIDLALAFEVQDFATHSRYSDSEKLEGKFKSFALSQNSSIFKKGPSYHNRKIALANAKGIRLVELWEDEILDGSYKLKIANSL